MSAVAVPRSIIICVLVSAILTGCTKITTIASEAFPQTPNISPTESTSADACPVTEPVWVKPPDDAAVQNEPEFGFYFVNQDRSIWASASWTEAEGYPLRVNEEGVKVGWFRPAGATLEISGRRVDGQAPALDAHIPCCYPTRFQATGLYFPTQGCWEVTAKAAESMLSFVVWVEQSD